MSTTVLEALQSAQINFGTLAKLGLKVHPIYFLAMDQLNNALQAIENNKSLNSVIQEHMFGEVDTGEEHGEA